MNAIRLATTRQVCPGGELFDVAAGNSGVRGGFAASEGVCAGGVAVWAWHALKLVREPRQGSRRSTREGAGDGPGG